MSNTRDSKARKKRRSRKAYGTAIGFLLAFVLSTATIVLTGLNVGAPRGGRETPPPAQEIRERAVVEKDAEDEEPDASERAAERAAADDTARADAGQ